MMFKLVVRAKRQKNSINFTLVVAQQRFPLIFAMLTLISCHFKEHFFNVTLQSVHSVSSEPEHSVLVLSDQAS